MFIIQKTTPFLLICITQFIFGQPLFAMDNYTAYLFVYFTGNNIKDESIHFAVSDNAHTFKALNNKNPVLSSTKISLTGGVRDPNILRG
jgi:arabinoxylan arabinofuranohydrolase